MQLALRGKNIEVTDALRGYVEKKLSKIEKHFEHPVDAQINLYVERGRHIVEVTAALNGLLLRGEERTNDMYASIDLVVEKLEKQLQKYKTRAKRQRGKENGLGEVAPAVLEPVGTLVKTKRFPAKPMGLDDAILQLELLSHDFFVFTNADTERINVLYRRKDGDYGLLEPEH